MPNMRTENLGRPDAEPPVGYEGMPATGMNCLRCGASIGKNRKWAAVHDRWHESLDGR